MSGLVRIIDNDVFTDTIIIAKGTGNEHRSVKQLVRRYENKLLKLNNYDISNVENKVLESKKLYKGQKGRAEKYYELNEPQATFLITLMKNNDTVISFKYELVKEFYNMRQIILSKTSEQWIEARLRSKLCRKSEIEEIHNFVQYATEQGSSNPTMYYVHFSNMVNKAVGINPGNRDWATPKVLGVIEMLEDMILNTIRDLMSSNIYYKKIYETCKERVEEMMSYIYLPDQRLLI